MATFNEAFPAAVQELDERGLLLNVHLVRLVDGDQQLLQSIREALIDDGLAQDRYGIGLSKSANFDTQRAAQRLQRSQEISVEDPPDEVVFAGVSQSDAEWWLMSGGATSGPLSLDMLIQMRRLGEVSDIDMVRQGTKGMWLVPSDVTELAEISPSKRPSSKRHQTSAPTVAEFVPQITASVTPTDNARRTLPVDDRAVVVPPQRKAALVAHLPSFDGGIEYFLWDCGKSIGPIGRRELEERLESGRLEANEFVQVGKDGDWQPLLLVLGAPRSPLQIPQSALNALMGERTADDMAATSPLPRTATPQAPMPVVGQSQPKPTKAASKQTAALPESPILRGWVQAGRFVGGQFRLCALMALSACAIALVIWWRQPPSAAVIYQELAATHKQLSESRQIQPGSNKPVRIPSEVVERIVAIKESLTKRASAKQPALQELLWACEYGLVPLFEQPYSSPELERVFADHMSRAGRLIDPAKAAPEQASAIEPVEIVIENNP